VSFLHLTNERALCIFGWNHDPEDGHSVSNLNAQFVLIFLALVAMLIVAGVEVGAWWLRLALIDLLAVILIKRLDVLARYFGVDLISDAVSSFITLLAISTILFVFVAAYMRRPYLSRAERERTVDLRTQQRLTVERLEALRAQDEQKHRQAWETITTQRIAR